MNKAYNPINWANNETSINAINLNKMSDAINTIDSRVVSMDKTLSEQAESNMQAVEAAATASEAKALALSAAERAEEAARNASAITGVQIATQDIAGLVKGGENHIAEDGTLMLTKRTTDTTLSNSYPGGIKLNEISGKNEQKQYSGKNELKNTATSQAVKDVVITINTDGSITANGTASELILFEIGTADLKGGESYILTGEKLSLRDNSGSIVYINTGATYTPTEDITVHCKLRIGSGETVTSFKTYPMVRKALIEDSNYEPYVGGIPSPNPDYLQEIKRVKGKNELDCSGLTEKTTNGATFTPVYDTKGTLQYINVNGTTTDVTARHIGVVYLKAGETYILSGCPSGGETGGYRLDLRTSAGALYTPNVFDHGSGAAFTPTEDITLIVAIRCEGAKTLANKEFYPMIRKASIADDTYVPYGCLRIKTHGGQLVKEVNAVEDVLTAYNTVFRVKADLKPNTQYTFSFKGTIGNQYYTNENLFVEMKVINVVDGTNTFTVTTKDKWESSQVTEDGYAILKNNRAQTNLNKFEEVMVNYGTTVQPYEPYQESAIILSQPIELNEKDKIIKQEGIFGVLKGFHKANFNQLTWGYSSANDFYFSSDVDTDFILSTHYRYLGKAKDAEVAGMDDYTITSYASGSGIRIKDSRFNGDVALFRTALSEIEFYYAVSEPTFEPLPTADQIALNSLVAFGTVTYLSCDSEIAPIIDLEYGTSQVGAYTLDAWNTARRNEIITKANAERMTALEALATEVTTETEE